MRPGAPGKVSNKIHKTGGEKFAQFLIYFFVAFFAIACLLPFVLVIIVSFTEEKFVTINGYSFFPQGWSTAAYQLLFSPTSAVPQAYKVTGIATVR